MPLCYDTLPGQLLALLQAGRAVTVRWDCGSDDYLVTTQVDGVEQVPDLGEAYYDCLTFHQAEYEAYLSRITSLPVLLGDFVAGRLGLPSVGEFSMQGGGRILLEGNDIVLEFQSDATSCVDNPDGWLPEEYLSATELTELCPERLLPGTPDPEPMLPLPDPELAAAYSGRVVLCGGVG